MVGWGGATQQWFCVTCDMNYNWNAQPKPHIIEWSSLTKRYDTKPFFLGTFSKFFAVVFITCLLMKRNFYVCLMFNNFTFYSPIRCLYSVQLNDDGRENADKTFQFNIVHQSCIKVHCPALVLQCCSASNDALECRVCSGESRERPAPGPGRDQLPP